MKEIKAKVVLIGSIGVGKTSLVQQYVHRKFSEKYLSTIGVRVDIKVSQINGYEVSLLIWDLAGEIMLKSKSQKYVQGATAVIGVFDLTRPDSYLPLDKALHELRADNPDLLSVCIGNKADLVSPAEINELFTGVNYDFLTSAKTGENVQEALDFLCKKIITSTHEKRILHIS